MSRIPRVAGGGTHRSGQGAFGNMCRGGRMFAPTRQWRRWQRRVNQGQRRFAIASALAASAVPALVMARGHDVEDVTELPLVRPRSCLLLLLCVLCVVGVHQASKQEVTQPCCPTVNE